MYVYDDGGKTSIIKGLFGMELLYGYPKMLLK